MLQSSTADDQAAEARPQWHWVLIATGLAVTLWLPLATLSLPLGARLSAYLFQLSPETTLEEVLRLSRAQIAGVAVLTAGPVILAFALSCLSAGLIVGRFCPRAQVRTSAMGCFVAGTAAWSVAATGGALAPWPVAVTALVVLGAVALGAGAWGARVGSRKRLKS